MYFGADPIDPRTAERETLRNLIPDIPEPETLRDLILDLEGDADTHRRRLRDSAGTAVDTHWSRILSCDLETTSDRWLDASPALADADRDNGPARRARKYLIVAAVVLLATYATAYLAVAAVLYVLDAPDAVGAITPDISLPPAASRPAANVKG